MDIIDLLQLAVDRDASDLHLIAGCRPVLRIHGKLVILEAGVLTPDHVAQSFFSIAGRKQQELFNSRLEIDFAYSLPNGRRFRVNACRQRDSIALAIRVMSSTVPDIDRLGLPAVCKELVLKRDGLVLLTGPTGCGKSTTLAAMIGYLNQTRECRVITIEDPIEHVYANIKCLISQREVGVDTLTFADALKYGLRQDPDVLMVGEMRDVETASMVLMAAETGHLVLSTGHASSAPLTVERVIDLFPAHQQPLAQARLAAVLQGVLCQRLLPRADGFGRVPAVEVMLANNAVRNTIREGKTHQLHNVIRTNQQSGMCSLDDSILRLYRSALVTREDVLSYCVDVEAVYRSIAELSSLVHVGR